MKKHHDISDVHFEGDRLHITVDGESKTFPLAKVSPALQEASQSDRNSFEISPSGYGIHWPALDEDISIDGLLRIVHARKHSKHAA